MSFDLTNKNIQDTFQNLLQKTGSDGRLFDLEGNAVRDLVIDGTLTANTYITSQSIVNTSSGSTAFGNSSDDSHTFQGHITTSGNISSSGTITGNAINVNGTNVLVAGGVDISTDTNLVAGTNITLAGDTLNVDDAFLKNNTDDTTSGVITAGGFTTAGNISASGNITGSDIFASSGFYGTLQTAAQPNITSLGDLTTLTIDDITINGSEISTNADFLTFDVLGDIVLNADGGDINFKDNTVTLGGVNNSGIFSNNNITASGNISASNLFVDEITAGNTLTIGKTTVLKKSFTTDNDGLNFKSGSTTMATFANSTGNFGIGTTTPSKKLTVQGDISSSGNVFTNKILLPTGDALGIIFGEAGTNGKITDDGSNLIFNYADSDVFQVNDSRIQFEAPLDITDATDATDASGDTGALKTEGGASIAKRAYVGTQLSVGSHITASGNISSSITSTGSFGRVEATKFVGDGSGITGLTSAAISTYNSSGNDRIITSVNSSTVQGESNLTFNSDNQLTVNGDITSSGNISGSTIEGQTIITDVFLSAPSASITNLTNTNITASGNISGSTIEGQTIITDVFLSAPSASITNLTNTNITSSGHISASGNIITKEIEAHSNFTIDAGGDIELNADGAQITMKDGAATSRFTFNLDTTPELDVAGAFTIDCSSDMSIDVAGGNLVLAKNGTTRFDFGVDDTPEISTIGNLIIDPSGGNTLFDSHITASGNISSSGTIFANKLEVTEITSSFVTSSTSILIQNITSSGDSLFGNDSTDIHTFTGDITASGDLIKDKFVQMTNSQSVVDTFTTSSFRSSKYIIQVTSASNHQLSELLVLHHSGVASNTEYAQINSGLNLVNFSTDISVGGDVRLIASSSFVSCSVRYDRTLIRN